MERQLYLLKHCKYLLQRKHSQRALVLTKIFTHITDLNQYKKMQKLESPYLL